MGRRRARRLAEAQAQKVHRITTAADSLHDDQARRTRRYLIQMSIRLVCLVAAVFAHGIVMWLLLAGAIVLPYIAVIEANVGRDKRELGGPLMEYRQLPGTPGDPPTSDPGSSQPPSGEPHD